MILQIKKAVPPLSLHGQLLWREFFYCAATRNPSFDKMVGNPICVQIPWDHNAEAIAKWANVRYVKLLYNTVTIKYILYYVLLILSYLNSLVVGSNWISMDRCNHDTTSRRGVDSPPGKACCCMFLNKGRSMDLLGRGHEGN